MVFRYQSWVKLATKIGGNVIFTFDSKDLVFRYGIISMVSENTTVKYEQLTCGIMTHIMNEPIEIYLNFKLVSVQK